mgnify:FL=1
MLTTNNLVFKGLKIVAWIIFVGLCIEAGGLLVNFIFSIVNPEMVDNLYQKLDLSEMYNRSKWAFFSMYSFILFIAFLKAYLFYIVVKLVTQINLSKPFNKFTSREISKISYFTFSIGLLSQIALRISLKLKYYEINTDTVNEFYADSKAFILMSAVIYVIAIIFAKGVEFQEEIEEIV